jgi:hypothetical protein
MTRLQRTGCAALVAACLALASLFLAQSAAAYNGIAPAVSISDNTPAQGESETAHLANMTPNSDGTVTLHSAPTQLATFHTDANGSATVTFTIPKSTTLGAHELWFDDTSTAVDPDATASINVHAGGGGGGLAGTGVAVAGIGGVGVLLLVAGGLLVLAGRRRRATVS